jgi:hypothetical protein
MTAGGMRQRRVRERRQARKDRLIQTRVAEELESTLKREAARRRLTVSHLIRNTLEDTFSLVEGVTTDVEQLVSGSVELAAAVGRDARRLASLVRGRSSAADAVPATDDVSPLDLATPEPRGNEGQAPAATAASRQRSVPGPPADSLDHIYGWNRLVANRSATCTLCGTAIERGDDALVGHSDDPSQPRAWLCSGCGETL